MCLGVGLIIELSLFMIGRLRLLVIWLKYGEFFYVEEIMMIVLLVLVILFKSLSVVLLKNLCLILLVVLGILLLVIIVWYDINGLLMFRKIIFIWFVVVLFYCRGRVFLYVFVWVV